MRRRTLGNTTSETASTRITRRTISGQDTASCPVEACSTVRVAAAVMTTGAADRPPAARTCWADGELGELLEGELEAVAIGVAPAGATQGAALVSCAGSEIGTVAAVDDPPHPPRPVVCRASSDMRSSSCSRPTLMCRIRATERALCGAPWTPARNDSRRWERLSSEPMHP